MRPLLVTLIRFRRLTERPCPGLRERQFKDKSGPAPGISIETKQSHVLTGYSQRNAQPEPRPVRLCRHERPEHLTIRREAQRQRTLKKRKALSPATEPERSLAAVHVCAIKDFTS